jgi:hypothetical protein
MTAAQPQASKPTRKRNGKAQPQVQPQTTPATKLESEVCGFCRGARGPAVFAVRVEIYMLEDLPVSGFRYYMCRYCARKQVAADKRKNIQTYEIEVR